MYYDLLARTKNAFLAEKISLLSPFSKMDFEIAKILTREKYFKEVQKKVVNRKNFLEIKLAYQNHKPSFRNFKIMSKPGRHLYRRHQDLRPVKNGYGLAILSTPRGLLDNKEAKKNKVGGEYLFEIW